MATHAGRYWEQQRSKKEAGSTVAATKGASKKIKKPPISKSSDPKAFLDDLIDSVCMLQRDGLQYSFVHRSFQEYFAALFVTKLDDDKIYRILNAYSKNVNDNVIPMLVDMHRLRVEKHWIAPIINEMENIIDQEENGSVSRILSRLSSGVIVSTSSLTRFLPDLAVKKFGLKTFRVALKDVDPLFSRRLTIMARLYPILSIFLLRRLFSLEEIRSTLHQEIARNEHKSDQIKELIAFLDLPLLEKPERSKYFNLAGHHGVSMGPLGPADDWWLKELGFSKEIENVRASLSTIAKEVKVRATESGSIVDDMIPL
jgi:hypothetical protein